MQNHKIVFIALLLWLLMGFVLGLDYTSYTFVRGIDTVRYGISVDNLTFVYQLLFFLVSVALIFVAVRTDSEKSAKLFIITELVIWLIRLMLLKDGYMVGIAGKPDEEIVLYDFVALLLRLLLLLSLFRIGYKAVSLAAAVVVAGLFIYLKASMLSEPVWYLPN